MVSGIYIFFSDHNEIQPLEIGLAAAEIFPNYSLELVPGAGQTNIFFGYYYPQPRNIETVLSAQDNKFTAGNTFSGSKNFLKI